MSKPKHRRYFDPESDNENDNTNNTQVQVEPDVSSTRLDIITIEANTSKTRKWTKTRNPSKKRKNKTTKDQQPSLKDLLPQVPRAKAQKYSRGSGLIPDKLTEAQIRTKVRREKIIQKEKKIKSGLEEAARTEILLTEHTGHIQVDEGESSLQLKQSDIVKEVDLATATKSFQLRLKQFAPYSIDYSLNGRQLAIGGSKGHVAAFDWVSKRLLCEFNVMESVHDVKWLHNETLLAVAQKEWTYVYDNQGIEVHCLKKMDRILALDFLPYHFLLVGGHQSGFLSWVDVSIGKVVAQFGTRQGPLGVLTSNPSNAVIHTGHSNGTVTLWSPTVKRPLASIMCHGSPVSAIAVDNVGRLMATSARDGRLRIWDLRNSFTPLTSISCGVSSSLSFSQKGLLAHSTGNTTMIISEIAKGKKAYMKHTSSGLVVSSQFCPFEDVLGLGTWDGIESCIVPGSGEPNFDALERNPFQTKQQRREAEVKALLEKIQPELITLDNNILGDLDTETLMKNEAQKPAYLKKADIKISHKRKRKTAKIPKVRQGLQSELKLRGLRTEHQLSKESNPNADRETYKISSDPLERFFRKKKQATTDKMEIDEESE